ncbi:MAG: hypothetical protein ACRECO_06470 [Xanthobacteraceae bacterium]
MMDTGDARDAVSRHLLDAIERVRKDVEAVEFWADAVAGFSQPVPHYRPDDVTVWMPNEQGAAELRSGNDNGDQRKRGSGR